MPFEYKKDGPSGKPHCIYRVATKSRPRRKMGCHETKKKALRQLAALQINVVDAAEKRTKVGAWEETTNEWRYRVRQPGDFQDGTFRTKRLTGTKGLYLVVGKLKKKHVPKEGNADAMVAQSYRFEKRYWKKPKAQEWIDGHVKADKPIPDGNWEIYMDELSWAEIDLSLDALTVVSDPHTGKPVLVLTTRSDCRICDDDPLPSNVMDMAHLSPKPLHAQDDESGEEQEGKTFTVTGRILEARERGKLHDHDFSLVASVDEDGNLQFEGETGEGTGNQDHTHDIATQASDPSHTEYQIETETASSGDSHVHLIDVVLPEALGPSDHEEAEEEEEESVSGSRELRHGKADERHLEAAAIRLGEAGLVALTYVDDAGFVCFRNGPDKHRNYQGSSFAFIAAVDSGLEAQSPTGVGKPKLSLSDDNVLYHEVLRTGEFFHPWHGWIFITKDRLDGIKSNFDRGVLGTRVAMNPSHQHQGKGLGWALKLEIKPKKYTVVYPSGRRQQKTGYSLYSFTELTNFGKREIVDDEGYGYTSIEVAWKMAGTERLRKPKPDPKKKEGEEENIWRPMSEKDRDDAVRRSGREIYENVLLGYAATNYPFIPQLQPFAASADENDTLLTAAKLIEQFGDVAAARKAVEEKLIARGQF